MKILDSAIINIKILDAGKSNLILKLENIKYLGDIHLTKIKQTNLRICT